MLTIFLTHKWKQFFRSTYFTQGIAIMLLMGFVGIYFLILAIVSGFLMGEFLGEGEIPAHINIGRFLLVYMFADVTLRFFFDNLSAVEARHYMLLKVKKSSLIHFLLSTSIINYFTLLSLAVILPFFKLHVLDVVSPIHAVSWLCAMVSVILLNHFSAIYLKRISAVSYKSIATIMSVALVVGLLTYLEWLSIYDVSFAVFKVFFSQPLTGLLLLIPLALIYRVNYRLLRSNIYIDKWLVQSGRSLASDRFNFISEKGLAGTLIAQELKLITRNKRTKNILWVTLVFAFYGLLFYPGKDVLGNNPIMITFVGIFITGAFMINYGQFLTAWESGSFDGILTRQLSVRAYYRAKWIMLSVSCVILFLITLPYAYFGWKILLIHFACLIFNIGFNSFILLYASIYNNKRIDLSKSSMMNYQGTGATQFLITIPLLLIPIFIIGVLNALNLEMAGIASLAGVGLLSLAAYPLWMKEIERNFKEKKYKKAAGFRQKA